MTWRDTPLTDLFGIRLPILQAPMLGSSTPAMAAAACRAGGMGSVGVTGYSPERIAQTAQDIRNASNGAFNLNFFAHQRPARDAEKEAALRARLQPWYDHYDLGPVPEIEETEKPFSEADLEAVLRASPAVVSFHFGLPAPALVAPLKDAGIKVMSSATSVAEAVWLQDHGVDAIIAQGYEAGGHNGHFLPRDGAQVTGTMALVPRVVDAVDVPVIAAGGIADGRGIRAAFALGAHGVQIGTAFLATPECSAPVAHKAAVLAASGDDTSHTRAFSGRPARGVVNDYMRDMDGAAVPEFPLLNHATGPLRRASAAQDGGRALSLWAGQAAGLVRAETTAEVMARLEAEVDALF